MRFVRIRHLQTRKEWEENIIEPKLNPQICKREASVLPSYRDASKSPVVESFSFFFSRWDENDFFFFSLCKVNNAGKYNSAVTLLIINNAEE